MDLATEIPLLAGLSKVDLAKLLTDTDVRTYQAGEQIVHPDEDGKSLYFILHGDVEVAHVDSDQSLPLLLLGAGSTFGETGMGNGSLMVQSARAVSEAQICRVPLIRFQRLLASEPRVAQEFIALLTTKLGNSLHELARSKRMLAAYVDEVWSSAPALPDEVAAAATPGRAPASASSTAPLPPRRRSRTRTQTKQQRSWVRPAALLASTALPLVALRLLDGNLGSVIAILLWAACNWLLGYLPDYVVAMAASTLLVLTGAVTPSVAFAGFANSTWFLLLGVLGIGVAVSRSGLVYRVALHMLRLFPPTYRGQSLALGITGMLFTPLLPSSVSRTAIGSPLARELSEAMRFPSLGKGSAGLAMSSFLGFGQMYFLFLNGGSICMLSWSLMPAAARLQVTWTTWLWLALPLGLLTFAGGYSTILASFPPETSAAVSRHTISAQLQILGRMTRNERWTSWVLGLVLVGFVTQPLHGVDPAWLALPGFLLLISLGNIDKAGLKELDWSFLLLIGSLVSLSDVTKVTGLGDMMTSLIGPMVHPFAGSPYLFLAAVAVLMLVVRLAIPLQTAVLVMVIALLPVSIQLGYHPIIIVLTVLAMSNSWVIPQQNTMYLTAYAATEERCFTHQQVRWLGLIHALVGVLAVIASVPFWQYMGFVPR